MINYPQFNQRMYSIKSVYAHDCMNARLQANQDQFQGFNAKPKIWQKNRK